MLMRVAILVLVGVGQFAGGVALGAYSVNTHYRKHPDRAICYKIFRSGAHPDAFPACMDQPTASKTT